jgi:rod shape determining protein RodA
MSIIKQYFKRYDLKRYNLVLIAIVIILGMIGAFLIKQVQADDENLYLKHLIGISAGIIGVFILSFIDYHFISAFYLLLYVINLVLLVLVKFTSFGVERNSSRRWLHLVIEFQPSELTKIIVIIFAAKLFTIFRQKINNAWVLLLAIVSVGIPTGLILIQTNLSTSLVIMFIFATMIFASGVSWKIIIPVIAIGVPAVVGFFWYIQQDYQAILQPYQRNRVLSFLNQDQDEYKGNMYQQDNSVLAIGTGQLYGKVWTDKAEVRHNYDSVPISESDFIFSVAGEEFGFIGCCFIIGLYAVIIGICLTTARKAPDYMGMLIAVGMASMFAFQLFVNIGVATKVLPNTGIPLPFMSSGLSSFISGMMAVGIILNIRLQPQKNRGRT